MKIFSRSVVIMLSVGILLLSAGGCELMTDLMEESVRNVKTDAESQAVEGVGEGLEKGNYREGVKQMDKAEDLRREGKIDEAARLMDQAIRKNPKNWDFRISRMAVAFEQDKPSTAETQRVAALDGLGTLTVSRAMDQRVLDGVIHPYPPEEYRYYTKLINTLESPDYKKMIENKNPETKKAYYRELEYAHIGRYEANRSMDFKKSGAHLDLEAAENYDALRQTLEEKTAPQT